MADIRNFFSKVGGSKEASAGGAKRPAAAAGVKGDDGPPATKKSKFFDKSASPTKLSAKDSKVKPEVTPTVSNKSNAAPKGKPVKGTPTKAVAKRGSQSTQASPAAKTSTPGRAMASRGAKRPSIVESDDSSEDERHQAVTKRKPLKMDDSDEDAVIEVGSDSDSDDNDFEVDVSEEAPSPAKPKSKPSVSAVKRDAAAKATSVPPAAAKAARALPKSFAATSSIKESPAAITPKAASQPQAASVVKSPSAPASKAKPRGKMTLEATVLANLDDTAKAAVRAVDAAMKLLPPEEELKFSLMEEGGFSAFGGGDRAPANPGGKEVPMGHPDAFTGKTLVVSGALESLSREQAEDLFKRHGGKTTSGVSGKTTFLLVGNECGRSKSAKAKEKGTQLIDEEGLFALVRATEHLAPEPGAAAASPEVYMLPEVKMERPVSPGAGPSSSAAQTAAHKPAGNNGGQLWVEKYKPASSKELVGNVGCIDWLRAFLVNWDRVHMQGQQPILPKSGGKPKDMSKKAVLLSGPPGIGKTSSALIVSRELGFLPVEVNASDTRNKSDKSALKGVAGKLSNSIRELATNTAIGVGVDGKPKRVVLVMDEVDGMSGGDRGGVADLIETIKRSKVPVIAICNDKYHQKLRSLRNHCLELEFRKPTPQQITVRMMTVAAKEGLSLNTAAMTSLVAGANGDLRLVLGQLQMLRLRAKALTYDDVRGKMAATKDFDQSPFECARKLLDGSSASLRLGDKIDLAFQDMDLVPLLIQENYLNHRPALAGNEQQRLRVIAKAADALSCGDVVNRRVRQYQNWSLMPFGAVISAVYPSSYMRGQREVFGLYPGEMNFPRFSAWFGSNSSAGKQRRLLGEMHTRMLSSAQFAGDRSSLRLQYLPALKATLTAPLLAGEKEGIRPVVEEMHSYALSKDDFEYVLDVTKFKSKATWAEDPYKKVPTTVKSAFTRAFNSQHVRARCNLAVEEFKVGKGKASKPSKSAAAAGGGGGEGDELAEGGDLEEVDAAAAAAAAAGDEEEEDDDDPEAAVRRLKSEGISFSAASGAKKGGRGSGKASTSGRGRGSAASSRGRGSGRGKK